MLGELSVFNAPDIDGSVAEALSGGRKPTKCIRVRRSVNGSCNDLVTGNNAILHLHLMVRRCLEQILKEFDLSGKAGRASPRMLNVRLGADFAEDTGILRI